MKTLIRTGLALVLLASFGCMSTRDAVEFNNRLAEANKQLNDSGQVWGKALAPALTGQAVDGAEAKRGVTVAIATLELVRKQMKELSVPGHETARVYYKAHQTFLEVETKLIEVDLPALAELAGDASLEKTQRALKMQKLLSDMVFAEQQALHTFSRAQNAFCSANGLKVENDPKLLASYVLNSVIMGNQRLHTAGEALGIILRPALAGGLLRAPEADVVVEDFKKVLEEVRAVVTSSDFTGNGNVTDLLAAEKAFLDVESQEVASFPEVVRTARDANLDAKTRQAKLKELLMAAVQKEQEALAKVKSAAEAVAAQNPGAH